MIQFLLLELFHDDPGFVLYLNMGVVDLCSCHAHFHLWTVVDGKGVGIAFDMWMVTMEMGQWVYLLHLKYKIDNLHKFFKKYIHSEGISGCMVALLLKSYLKSTHFTSVGGLTVLYFSFWVYLWSRQVQIILRQNLVQKCHKCFHFRI